MDELYAAFKDEEIKHKEIVITGKEGRGLGKTHAVVNVAIKLQNEDNYKCILVDLRKVFNDFSNAKAVDIMKPIMPTGSLIDILGNVFV